MPTPLLLILAIVALVMVINGGGGSNGQKKLSFDEIVRIHIIQASRWGIASLSDQSPFIANLHGNYSVGYLIALRSFASDQQIKEASGVDIIQFEREITNVQRKAAQKLGQACPNVIGVDSPLLVSLSQLEV